MEIKVVDEIMGRGKSWASINYINSSDEYTKFIVITPYLKEVDRYKNSCRKKKFKAPIAKSGSKLYGLRELIANGENIVSTHALFHRFDKDIIRMIREMNYVLILDEVTDVIQEYDITKQDWEILKKKFINVDEKTGLMEWRKTEEDYEGKFSEVKKLCELNSLALYGGSVIMWLFPIEVFDAFEEVYILTYMFNSQIQRYYYDFHNVPYTNCYVKGNSIENFSFSDTPDHSKRNVNYRKLINICDNEKLNRIGDQDYSLSKKWYIEASENGMLRQLSNNIYNYYRHVCESKSSENLWTTFSDYRIPLKQKGYSHRDCFLEINARATNEKRNRKNLAYTVNRFLNPVIKNFFMSRGIDVQEDDYALSEMVQFVWRSAIRDNKPINVYIPSKRMRSLLRSWIDEISCK